MYDIIVELVGTLPQEFNFIYAILTLVFSTLIFCFLFQLFFLPLKLINGK